MACHCSCINDPTSSGSPCLGLCQPKWITAFPYSLGLPHPMIVGSIIGLLGAHLQPAFRTACPWLVPAHIACYFVHLMQVGSARMMMLVTIDVNTCVTLYTWYGGSYL